MKVNGIAAPRFALKKTNFRLFIFAVVFVVMKMNEASCWSGKWTCSILLLVALVSGSNSFRTGVKAADWPVYRGPNHDGISLEKDWNSDWPETGPKILWRASVGTGYSSIVISQGRAYTMGNSGGKDQETDTISCFNAKTGQVIWKHSYPCALQPLYFEGGTQSTPTVDGASVYSLSKMGDLFCLDATSGEVKWQVNVNKDLGFKLPTWSFSSSPLVIGERLILNLGSAGVSLNKKSGKLLWENGKDVCGYATPVPCEIEGQKCVVIAGAEAIIGVRIEDGEVLWEYPFTNKHKATAADPLVKGNEIFVSSAYGRGCVKVRIANGKASLVFDNKVMRNLMSCSVLRGDQIYGFDEYELKCIDFADSRERWAKKRFGKGSLMMSVDGRMIIMGEQGEMAIARANTEKFELLASAQILPKGMCRTVPVLANGLIYARNAKGDLVCLDVRRTGK